MAIDPRVIASAQQREATQIADLGRRVTALEAVRTQFGADSISGAAIAPNSITTTEIAAGTILASDIAANTITAGQIAANTITAGQIAANTITAAQIAANTITATQIAANTITAGQIAAATITASQIATGTITASLLAANSVTASAILAGSIDATKIATDTLTANQIAAGAITASELAANSVTASAILAGAVTATKISVTDLGSITSNMGSITAGTITGGTIQTAASGSRTVMDSNGLRGYALDGVTKVFEINSGSGIATFTGTVQAGSTIVPSVIPTIGGGNLIANSSFEDQSNNGTSRVSLSGYTRAFVSSPVYHGSSAMQLTSATTTGSAAGVYQTVTAIRPGASYVLSTYARSQNAGQGSPTLIINWYSDLAQTALISQTTTGNFALTNTDWTRITMSATAPAAAVSARLYFFYMIGSQQTNGQVYYVDAIQFAEGLVPAGYSPMPYESSPSQSTGAGNLAPNSSFEDPNFVDWGTSSSAITGVVANRPGSYGTRSVQVTSVGGVTTYTRVVSATGRFIQIEAGKAYTFSAYGRNVNAVAARSMQTIITYHDAAGTQVGGTFFGNVTSLPDANWYRAVVTATAPAGSTQARVYVAFVANSGNIPAAEVYQADDVQMEQSDYANAYNLRPGELWADIGGFNLLNNTTFANLVTNAEGWTQSGFSTLTTSASPLKYGAVSLQATSVGTLGGTSAQVSNFSGWTAKGTTTAQNVPNIEAGRTYTLSVWVRGDPANTGSALAGALRFMTYDSTATTNVDSLIDATNKPLSNTAWTRWVSTFTVPAASTATKMRVLVYPEYGLGSTVIPNANKYYFSGVQLEEGSEPTAYTPKADEITPLSVGTNEIAALAITAGKIAANTITAGQIAANTITAGQITAGTITATEIAGTTITAAKIAANTITAAQIAAGTITATQIATGTLTALQIAAGTITGNEIAAGTITAQKLTLDWGGSNILWDSSFEDATSSPNMWEANSFTMTNPNADIVPVSGGRVCKIVTTSTASPVLRSTASASVAVDPNTGVGPYGPTNAFPGYYPVLKGKNYTLSAYVSSPAVSRNTFMRIYWYDGLRRQQLPAPTLNSVVAIAGGSLTATTTYFYKVTAVNANGETVGSNELSVATTGTNKTITVNATMPADAQGTDYPVTKWRIYRGTATGVYTAGYIEQTATGGAVVSFNDTGTALTAGTIPSTNTAGTIATGSSDGTSVATELPTTTPNPPVTTSPTVVTGPFVVTGAAGGTLWSRWVRPFVSAVVPTGVAYARVALIVNGPNAAEVHYVDGMQFERGDGATGYARRVGEVLPGEVGATQITPNSITTNQILAAGINADRLTAASITATQIQANTIDASKMTVATLSAITANMGTITAGTITGATFQTAASGARVVFNSTGINAFDASAVNTFNLSSTGSLTMLGKLNATGVDFTEPVGSAFAWSPPATAKVRYLDASGGTERGFVVGDRIFATVPIAIDIHRMSMVGQDWAEVMTGPMTAPTAKLHVEATTVYAQAGSTQVTLVNSNGTSGVVRSAGVVNIANQTPLTAGQQGFSVPHTGTYLFYACVTAWVNSAGVKGLMGIGIDGFVTQASLYYNQASVHMTMNPTTWTQSLSAGSHNLNWRSDAWVTWDANDTITCFCIPVN